MQEVVEPSKTKLVLVAFWAPWSEPTRAMINMIAQYAEKAQGQWIFATVDADKYPDLAMQLGVQSVPMVYFFKGGRPIDGFMGTVTEVQFKQFLAPHLPQNQKALARDEILKHAQALWLAGESAQVLALLMPLLQQKPDDDAVALLFGRALYLMGQGEGIQELLMALKPESTAYQTLSGLLKLLQEGASPACELFKKGQYIEAFQTSLNHLKTNLADETVKSELFQMFDALGQDHPAVLSSRRQLSSLLFA